METNGLQERRKFVEALSSGYWSMSELCAQYGISRPVGYKWMARYRAEGPLGLEERSRAPQHCPHRTAEDLEARILTARKRYRWGARKLRRVLVNQDPMIAWPALSTINDILDRHGLLQKRRRRRRWTHPGSSPLQTTRPNQVWPADFKGQFKIGIGAYCYPLTVTDHFSRRVLVCHAMARVSTAETQAVFRALFRRVGLPDAIRTDNGEPFASVGLRGLSRLSVWWMQLGIVHQRIRPARPQENGSHERMHRELKRETTRPAAGTLAAQQRRFDRFRARYNDERPHEALGERTPTSVWLPSPRTFPERVAAPEYPAHMEVRRVSRMGTIRLRQQRPFLTQVLDGQDVGLEEIDDGIWNIVYYQTLLGRLDERTRQITGA